MRRSVLHVALLGALLLPLHASGAPLRIVVDPGHGGDKDGAISPTGAKEKDVALAISKRLAATLGERGYEVILTRTRDESLGLAERIALANTRRADLFLSVHANSVAQGRAHAHGVETYFLSTDATDAAAARLAQHENSDDRADDAAGGADVLGAILADLARSEAHADSSRLAYSIQARVVRATKARNRGVRQAPFLVLEGAQMPAVLIEVGYISHPRESEKLADPKVQAQIAASIAQGVEDYRRAVQPRNRDAADRLSRLP